MPYRYLVRAGEFDAARKSQRPSAATPAASYALPIVFESCSCRIVYSYAVNKFVRIGDRLDDVIDRREFAGIRERLRAGDDPAAEANLRGVRIGGILNANRERSPADREHDGDILRAIGETGKTRKAPPQDAAFVDGLSNANGVSGAWALTASVANVNSSAAASAVLFIFAPRLNFYRKFSYFLNSSFNRCFDAVNFPGAANAKRGPGHKRRKMGALAWEQEPPKTHSVSRPFFDRGVGSSILASLSEAGGNDQHSSLSKPLPPRSRTCESRLSECVHVFQRVQAVGQFCVGILSQDSLIFVDVPAELLMFSCARTQ
jgi:hypothetical protein